MGLNVVVCSHYFPPHVGGIESVVESHAANLAARGHAVTVLTSDVGAAEKRSTRDGYEVRRFRAWNPVERFGVPYPIPDPVDAARAFPPDLRRSADVVHAHGMNYLTTSAVLRCRRPGTPVVLHQHTPFVEFSRPVAAVERLNDLVVGRWNLRQADVVFPVSRTIEAYVRDLDPSARTELLTNGVDTTIYHPDRAGAGPGFDCDPSTPVFFTLARLTPKKGIDVVLAAARALDDSPVDCHLAIAGDGPMRSAVRRAATELTSVEYLGAVGDDALARLYAAADAFLFTSKHGEAFPTLSMLEAYASGTPVVAADLRPEHGDFGAGDHTVLVEPDSPRELIAAVRTLAARPDRRTAMGEAARRLAEREYDIDDRIDRLVSHYRRAVEDGGRSPAATATSSSSS